jgi:pyruvate kinase
MLTWKKRSPRSDPSSKPREQSGSSGWDLIYIARMIKELTAIHEEQKAAEVQMKSELDRIPEERRGSARNLLHYLALRARDIRGLQESLASMGLSSLGRAEGHIMYNVRLLLKHLHHLVRHSWEVPPGAGDVVTRHEGRRLLERRAARLLGEKPSLRTTRIMVTMPTEAATDYALVRDLVAGGMNAMRVNCAHDGPEAWLGMTAHLRRAEKEIGRRCSILMDLGGPKIRTGSVSPGPKVIKWKPVRDALGQPKTPARIWLTPAEEPQSPPEGAAAILPVRKAWIDRLEAGDRVHFRDLRGARRSLEISGVSGSSRWALSDDTCYVQPGTELARIDSTGRTGDSEPLGDLPCLEQSLLLKKGDRLLLTRAQEAGWPAVVDNRGVLIAPARISCTLPEALADVHPGDPVRFDDGKIDGQVLENCSEGLLIEITRAQEKGSNLGADKGINFPASSLTLPSLTDKDIEDLAFIARNAHMVGYSFVRSPEDLRLLRQRLKDLDKEQLGIILKIETQAAFDNLPALLLAALEAPLAGVMIARGDLAIECGYERLAELQEEILWLCEAAHLPVIWATQVLEHLAKDGQPSRAEVTDAAMGERAECVMLNKGPHVVEAVRSLDDIIRRMETHQSKKTPLLRPLKVASAGPLGRK